VQAVLTSPTVVLDRLQAIADKPALIHQQ
jgi:hypothetical protein